MIGTSGSREKKYVTYSNEIFDDMIAVMFSNNKMQQIVKELIIRGRRVNIPLVYITECYFVVPETFNCKVTLVT